MLGEEPAGGGTARYVDSSVERLQVQGQRHDRSRGTCVTCNGRRVPLHPTGTPGEFVAGVRYPRLAAAVLPASDDRRARAAGVRPGRHLERAARSAAAPTTSRIRAGAATRLSRSTPTRPKAAAWRGSFRSGTPAGRSTAAAGGIESRLSVHARPAAASAGGDRWTKDVPA